MKRYHVLLAAFAFAFATLVTARPGYAQPADLASHASTIYRLDAAATYGEGCLPPCACPWFPSTAIDGTFRLTRISVSQFTSRFKVTEVNWLVTNYDGSTLRITGEGEYAFTTGLPGAPPSQRLQLKLFLDEVEGVGFDSGIMPYDDAFPRISIDVADNEFYCYNRVIEVSAVPVQLAEIQRYTLSDSAFIEGCQPPCLCPLAYSELHGRFGLVRLAERNDETTWGVVNVQWTIGGPSTEPDDANVRPVRGNGIYRTAGNEQRMWATLTVGPDPADEFDSGWTNRPNDTPVIDIAVADNDFYCFNRIFDIHAAPVTLTPARAAP